MSDRTTRQYIEETRDIWEAKAAFWDDYIGAGGNEFHRLLVAPAQSRLLALQPGETVLDVACGNGQFAREMARTAARVVAIDVSPTFIERAERHTAAEGRANIDYRLVDATDEAALLALGERSFDAAACGMALMDIPVIDPLLRALRRLLRPGGRFVFSVTHPCFNHPGARMSEEQEERDGSLVVVHAMKVVHYLGDGPRLGTGIRGEPGPHWYFSRPLSTLLGACFAAGFVMDGIEEPAFAPGTGARRSFDWANYPHIPPVLAIRLRNP